MRWLNYLRVSHGGLRVVAAGVVTIGSCEYSIVLTTRASGLAAQPLLSRWLAVTAVLVAISRPSWSCA
jgi:hypothetical protein